MQLLRQIFGIMLAAGIVATASAQITITQESLAPHGTNYLMTTHVAQPIETDVGPSGPNQNWIVPDIEIGFERNERVLDPSDTPFAIEFPTATRCIRYPWSILGFIYDYYQIQTDGMYYLGTVSAREDTAYISIYEGEGPRLSLPLTFGTQDWIEVTEITQGTRTTIDSSYYCVDGWGTIMTQFYTSNVIRLRQLQYIMHIIQDTPPYTDTTAFWNYYWLREDGIPAVHMRYYFSESDSSFTSGYVYLFHSITEAIASPRSPVAESFIVGQNYPNPFNPTTTLPITLTKAGKVKITIYNNLGEVVTQEEHEFGPGEHSVPFDGSQWASGNYFAQVRTSEQIQSKRMTLVK